MASPGGMVRIDIPAEEEVFAEALAQWHESGWVPCFRYCINKPSRPYYVEVADYYYDGAHFVGTRRDHVLGTARRTDLLPNVGDYFWVSFAFDDDNTCKVYFKSEYLETRHVDYSTLHYLYSHDEYFNASAVLSFHIVSEPGYPPLFNNLSDKPLGFIFVTATVTVEGSQDASVSGSSIMFKVFQDGTADDDKDSVYITKGTQNVDTVVFRILAYGVTAYWGGGSTTQKTRCDGASEVLVTVGENFTVNNVIVRTGMYNGW
ncbi:hypothetical protein MTO96_022969 [Rhipicephalus appendiculatus]